MWTKWFMWNKRKTLKTKQEVLLVLCFWLTENVHTKEIDRNSFILQLFLHLQKTKRTKGIFQVSCLCFLWSSWSKINDGCWVTLSNNTSIHESRPTINTREQKIFWQLWLSLHTAGVYSGFEMPIPLIRADNNR